MDFHILECKQFLAPSATSVIKRTVCNHELDYYVKGERTIYIDGKQHTVKGGHICFRRPGQEVYSFGEYNCYILTLDFSKRIPTINYSRNKATYIEPIYTHSMISSIPTVFAARRSKELLKLISLLSEQTDKNAEVSHMLLKEIFHLINADLCHRYYEEHNAPTALDEVFQYINTHYSERITLDELAALSYMDKSYLCRTFKKRFGNTPIEAVISFRLNHARDLLFNTDMTVKEIATACGYNDTSFFIAQYKRAFQNTPKEDRKTMVNRGRELSETVPVGE